MKTVHGVKMRKKDTKKTMTQMSVQYRDRTYSAWPGVV